MPFGNYNELFETVARWMDRADRNPEIPDWIVLVEQDAQRKLNLRSQDMVTPVNTLNSGSEFLITPPGVLYPRQLVFLLGDTIRPVTINTEAKNEEIRFNNTNIDPPLSAWVDGIDPATNGTQIRVNPPPSSNLTYRLYYTTGIAPLTAAAPKNYLLLIAPDIYFYGCLMQSRLYARDIELMTMWQGIYNDAMTWVRKIEWRSRAKAGRLRVQSDIATP